VAREIGAVKRAAGFVEKTRKRGISEETVRVVIQNLIVAARAEQ